MTDLSEMEGESSSKRAKDRKISKRIEHGIIPNPREVGSEELEPLMASMWGSVKE
jgi:hypothetical protein